MKFNPKSGAAVGCAILAAALYALNAPASKLLLRHIAPTYMAAFLYLGAGLGLALVGLVQKLTKTAPRELPLTKKELPYVVGMVVLDIAAPILLMLGLTTASAASASLLNNFEIVATSLIAFFIFRESISRRLVVAIVLVTLSSALLSFEGAESLSFSFGSLFVLLATVCWGLENNCTRMLSSKNPLEIVVIKGLFSGTGSFLIALMLGEAFPATGHILPALLLGFVAYGLSILFYIYAQRSLGAAKTSAYYALAPFIGVALSLLIFGETPAPLFYIALLLMLAGTFFITRDSLRQPGAQLPPKANS